MPGQRDLGVPWSGTPDLCCPECQSLDLLGASRLWLLRASGQMDSLAPEQGQRLCPPGQSWGGAGPRAKELLTLPLPSEIPPRFPCPVVEVVGFFEPAVSGGGDPDTHNVGREEPGTSCAPWLYLCPKPWRQRKDPQESALCLRGTCPLTRPRPGFSWSSAPPHLRSPPRARERIDLATRLQVPVPLSPVSPRSGC